MSGEARWVVTWHGIHGKRWVNIRKPSGAPLSWTGRQALADVMTEAEARACAVLDDQGAVAKRLVSRAEAVERARVAERKRIVAFIRGISVDGLRGQPPGFIRDTIAHCVDVMPVFDFAHDERKDGRG